MWGRNVDFGSRNFAAGRDGARYFSGYFRLKQRETGGAGVSCGSSACVRAIPRPFSRTGGGEITPQFLDRTIVR
jgi:hypothetical protein